MYPHIEKHARNGDVLDLGCGPGAVGAELNVNTYRSCTGVDICEVAIERARNRAAETDRTDKNEYFLSDLASYMPQRRYDVILFGDSIYYFSHRRILAILYRYSKYLTRNGVFLVRMWTSTKRVRAITSNIEKNFDILEKRLYHDSRIVVVAFRPKASPCAGERGG